MNNKFSHIQRYFTQTDNDSLNSKNDFKKIEDPKKHLDSILDNLKNKSAKPENLQPNIFNSYMDDKIINQSSFTTNPIKWLKDKGALSNCVNELLKDLKDEEEVETTINRLSILELKRLTTELDQMNSIEINSLMSMEAQSKVAIINDLVMNTRIH